MKLKLKLKRWAKKQAQSLAAIAVAMLFDTVIGEPPAKWHPVVWYGHLIKVIETKAPAVNKPGQLIYGATALLIATPFALIPAVLAKRLVRRAQARASHRIGYWTGFGYYILLEGICLKPFFALKLLVQSGQAVRLKLENDDLPGAREALQSLVSRDRSSLSKEQVAAAAIESLAENLNDSVVAPLFYYALFGLPGAAAYRLYNTFDSMIGYRGEYEYLGKAAARWDDLLNLWPARLTALLIIALAPFYGGSWSRGWQIWREDSGKTESPNAGHPMAAAAGTLGVQLEKQGHYKLGRPWQAPTPEKIRQAERMTWLVGLSAAGLLGLCSRGDK